MSRILITGVTGYVGGTVLSQLIANTAPSIKDLTFDLLIRDEAQAVKLRHAYGSRINTIKWSSLEDIAFIEDTASRYDIVINTGSGFIPEGAIAFVNGLARRINAGKPVPWMLHISGCTNLSDRPLTQTPRPIREWNDETDRDRILDFMGALNEVEPYPQRTTEVGVLKTAAATGVQIISVNTPCIFGEGTGLFNRQGLVILLIMIYVVQHGYGWKLNKLQTSIGFTSLILRISTSFSSGIMFAAVGRTLIKEIKQGCLDAAFADGTLSRDDTPKEKEVRLVPLQEIADKLTAGRRNIAERGWGGHKATKAVQARKLLGWEPKRLQNTWKKDFRAELVALKENRRMVTMENCIGAKK